MEINDFNFKRGSREWYIAQEFLIPGTTRSQATKNLFSKVGKIRPFIFTENTPGGRVPKKLDSQYSLFLYIINKVVTQMVKDGWIDPDPYSERIKWTAKDSNWVRWRKNFIRELLDAAQEPEPNFIDLDKPVFHPLRKLPPTTFIPDRPKGVAYLDDDEDVEIEEPKPKKVIIPEDEYDDRDRLIKEYIANASDPRGFSEVIHVPKLDLDELIEDFYTKMMKARSFVTSRELSGQYLDFISTRAIKDGCKGIYHGISVDEMMEAVIKTWPTETRSELKNWDNLWSSNVVNVIRINTYKNPIPNSHRFLGYIICLAEARIPIFLVGPSGCGKSFLARDLADALDMDYGELPLTAGATPSWLIGAETISGYKSRPFVEIYKNGGVFCFEEIDASDSNMLLLVNNALANEFLTNPITGQEIAKHDDFIAVATANTWGLGANRQFTGRERLDAATLDRWRVGRVEMDYDKAIEKQIVESWKEKAVVKMRREKKVKKAVKV